jgi:hypothetical protein
VTASTFTLTGGPALERRMKALGKVPKLMLRDIGVAGVREAKLLVPRRTGNLGRTIRVGSLTDRYVEVTAGGGKASGYAAAVEFGTKPHIIVPRTKKALAWGGARTLGGRLRAGSKAEFVRRRVRHPGNRAKPYMRPGLQKALQIVGVADIVKAWNGAA